MLFPPLMLSISCWSFTVPVCVGQNVKEVSFRDLLSHDGASSFFQLFRPQAYPAHASSKLCEFIPISLCQLQFHEKADENRQYVGTDGKLRYMAQSLLPEAEAVRWDPPVSCCCCAMRLQCSVWSTPWRTPDTAFVHHNCVQLTILIPRTSTTFFAENQPKISQKT